MMNELFDVMLITSAEELALILWSLVSITHLIQCHHSPALYRLLHLPLELFHHLLRLLLQVLFLDVRKGIVILLFGILQAYKPRKCSDKLPIPQLVISKHSLS